MFVWAGGRVTNGLRVVWTGCFVGRYTKGFRVVDWMCGWTGCLGGRLTNGFKVVDWKFLRGGGLVGMFTNGFRVGE